MLNQGRTTVSQRSTLFSRCSARAGRYQISSNLHCQNGRGEKKCFGRQLFLTSTLESWGSQAGLAKKKWDLEQNALLVIFLKAMLDCR
jgi:hypothetical protein